MHLLQEDIKKIVEQSGLVEERDFLTDELEAERGGRTVLGVLIGKGLIDEKYLTESVAKFFGLPVANLRNVEIPNDVLEMIPEAFAKSRGVVLFEFDKEKKRGKLAMIDPEDFNTIQYLRVKLDAWLDIHLISSSDIKYGLRQYKKKISEEFSKIIDEN